MRISNLIAVDNRNAAVLSANMCVLLFVSTHTESTCLLNRPFLAGFQNFEKCVEFTDDGEELSTAFPQDRLSSEVACTAKAIKARRCIFTLSADLFTEVLRCQRGKELLLSSIG